MKLATVRALSCHLSLVIVVISFSTQIYAFLLGMHTFLCVARL